MKSLAAPLFPSGIMAALLPLCLLTVETRCLEAAPLAVYAGTPGGVFKSIDGGANWIAVNNGLTTGGNLDVRALAINPATPETLYLTGVTGRGTWMTTDGVSNWTKPPSAAGGFALAVDPGDPATVYDAAPFVVSGTIDGGANWVTITNGLTNTFVESLAVARDATRTVYAGVGRGDPPTGVFKTTNWGASWSLVNAGMTGIRDVLTLAVDAADPAKVYAGTDRGVFKTNNAGAAWTAVNSGLTDTLVRALAIAPPTTPFLTITLNKARYTAGEVVTASVFRMANPQPTAAAVELQVWVQGPGLPPTVIIDRGGTGSLVLPAGFDQNFGPLPLYRIPAGSQAGTYVLGGRLLDPLSHQPYSTDLSVFTVQ